MADAQSENESSVQIRNRGEARETASPTTNQTEQVQQNQNQAQQQQEGSPWKSMIIRMVIFWLVINFFRSKAPSSPTKTENGKVSDSGPCSNVFRDGQLMVSYFLKTVCIFQFFDFGKVLLKLGLC